MFSLELMGFYLNFLWCNLALMFLKYLLFFSVDIYSCLELGKFVLDSRDTSVDQL